MRRLSDLIPCALVAVVAALVNPVWWVVALLAGAALFAWGWLWGDEELLQASHGRFLMAAGCVLLVLSLALAHGLGVTLAEFQATARLLRKSENLLYHLPGIGAGLLAYGGLIWGRGWWAQRG